MSEKEIGKVVHYFDKAMVAVVKLSADLKVGDEISMMRNEDDFEMRIESMQLNHEPIEKGKSGEEVALKVPKPVKEGYRVYLKAK